MEKFKNKTMKDALMNNPETFKMILSSLFERVESLEEQLVSEREKKNISSIIGDKMEKIDRIRHSLTELNERMERPYVVSAGLQAVRETLDVLSETGECNSVILEGEPGTGKTQWAYSEVGQELQEGKDVSLIHIRVKDTMNAKELLYSVDDVRRLSDAQARANVPEDIRREAEEWKQKILSDEINPATDEEYLSFREKMRNVIEIGETEKDLDYMNYVDLGPLGEAIYQSGKGKKIYLIIDEIEKGREELMTGILDEIENLTFTIEETGTIVRGDKRNLRIVITTNTEDSDKIPPSFRRRSLYHFMEYPDREEMAHIVRLHIPDTHETLLTYALDVFYQYHDSGEIEKKPSTPELLSWIRVLNRDFDGSIPHSVPHKEILLKYGEDWDIDTENASESDIDEGEQQYYSDLFLLNRLSGEKLRNALDKLEIEELERMSEDTDTPGKILRALSENDYSRIRLNIVRNKSTPDDVIRKLQSDEDMYVREDALEREDRI